MGSQFKFQIKVFKSLAETMELLEFLAIKNHPADPGAI